MTTEKETSDRQILRDLFRGSERCEEESLQVLMQGISVARLLLEVVKEIRSLKADVIRLTDGNFASSHRDEDLLNLVHKTMGRVEALESKGFFGKRKEKAMGRPELPNFRI